MEDLTQLNHLNEAQKQAVLHEKGPLLIIAGAGAGKTKTITERIGRLMKRGVPGQRILAITFTNKAAREMSERLARLISEATLGVGGASLAEGGTPFTSTFHALGAKMIKENARHLGLSKYFQILDKSDSLKLIKRAVKDLGLPLEGGLPGRLQNAISRQKNRLTELTTYQADDGAQADFFSRAVVAVRERYERLLSAEQSLDFDDLLVKSVLMLEREPAILEHYQKQWDYLHIDEYQDTNAVQYRLGTLLAAHHRNLCVVGDIDQSIYSWRGANFTNLLDFEKDYPDATVVTLEENYRSTKVILDFANRVIVENKNRKEKNLFTRQPGGAGITLIIAADESEEAALVAETIQSLIEKEHTPAAEIAILYRANFQSRALEEALLAQGINYQVVGTRFFERQEVKDVLALVRAALNPADIESTKRIINVPPRGLGKVTLAKMFSGQTAGLSAAVQTKIADFRRMQAAIVEVAERETPSELIRFVLKRSGLEASFATSGDESDRERLENLKELVTIAKRYDTRDPEERLWQFLTETALLSDQDTITSGGGVKLMTVHAAKGLEFAQVFVTGLEQDLFPSAPRPHSNEADSEERDQEEERRLFYVAITRAKKKLYLSYAETRTIFGNRQSRLPSEFLAHLEQEATTVEKNNWLIDF